MSGIPRELARQVWKMIEPRLRPIQNMISRGVVQLVDDSGGMQRVQVECNLGELPQSAGAEHTERPLPYGFFSVPLVGAHAVIIFPGGDRQHPITISVDDPRYRAKDGQPGEVGLRTDEGDEIRLGRSHVMTLTTSTLKLGSSSAAGDVVVQAALTGTQGFMAALDSAITALGANPAAAALAALKTALQALNAGQGWKAGTSKVKAE